SRRASGTAQLRTEALPDSLPSNHRPIARGPPMHQFRFSVCALLLLGFGPGFAGPPPHPVGVTIDDFSYVDTSGEVADQAAAHQRRLQAFMAGLRKDVASDGGAGIRVIGGIRKASTLV